MFKAIKELDRFKAYQTHYYLTQGDSCVIVSTPYKNGEVLKTGIRECRFKLADGNYKQIFSLPLSLDSDSGSYVLNLAHDYTTGLKPGQYFYEIEYTMENGDFQTPNSWKFDILPEIKDEIFGG